MPPKNTWQAPLFLFVFAFLIRAYFLVAYSFDGLYGQDSFAYFNQAVALAENLPRGHLPPLDFFWPNGYPLLAAVFMWMMGQTEIAVLLPVLLTGSALAPLAYLLCLEFFGEYGPRAGWLAGLIIAVAGQPIQSSVTSMADVPGLFWAMLAVWCLARAWKLPQTPAVPTNTHGSHTSPELIGTHRNSKGNLWELTLAGLFLAFATVTRWNYAMLALPFAVYVVYQTRQHKTPRTRLVAPVLVGFAVLLVQVWLSSHRTEGLLHPWLVGWHPRNFLGSAFQTPDGLQTFERPVWLFNLLPGMHPAYLFPWFGLAIPFGAWHTWRERNWGAMILLGGWFALNYAFLAGIPYENFRFGLALYPPLVLFASLGLALISMHDLRFTHHTSFKWVYWGLTVGGLLFMLIWATRMVGSFLETHTATKQQALEIAAQLPPDTTLLTLGPTLIFSHYTPFHMVEIYSTPQESLPELITEASSFYVLLNLPNLESQWKGLRPEQNFQWLKTHTLLREVGAFPPYTLYEVESLLP